MERTCADEAVPRQVLSRDHRLQKEAILRVLRYPEVCNTWRKEVPGKLHVYRDAVSSLLLEYDLLDRGERGKRR